MSDIDQTMEFNRRIPGQISDAELRKLIKLASTIPEGGIVVEVGALYGLSSWHIAQALPKAATLFSVDPWVREEWIINDFEKYLSAPEFGIDTFRMYTSECDNIVPIKAFSPSQMTGWNLPIDMYFEDAVHTNPILRENLLFWSSRVKSGGIISGHDFGPDFPDIKSEVISLVDAIGSDLEITDSLWSFRKK